MNRAVKTARLSVFSNTLLIIMKVAVGLASGSVSIISEAIHSLMDLAAAVMAFFSIRIARKPADREHPYGHDKAENVSGFFEAILILIAAVIIIIESVKKIINQEPVERLGLGVAVMLTSGIVNILVSRRLYKVAREEESIALAADALHLKTDVYSCLGVAFGLAVILVLEKVFSFTWASYLDPVVAMGIALFIIKEAWVMVRVAFGPLLDSSLSTEEIVVIEKRIAAYPGVSMHEIRTRRAGKKKYIDFHLSVPGNMTVKESHELCDEIERTLEKQLPNASVLIHIEPSIAVPRGGGPTITKDELLKRLEEIGRRIAGFELRVHHLHLFEEAGWTEITFHIAVEPGITVEESHRIASAIEAGVKEETGLEATVHVEPRTAE